MHRIRHIGLAASLLAASFAANAFSFDQDSYYASSGRTISQFSANGTLLDTVTPTGPTSLGTETRGIAFGGDGLMYVVRADDVWNNSGHAGVDVMNASGQVLRSYALDTGVSGNIAMGNIAFAGDGHTFYVAGYGGVYQFDSQTTDAGHKIINDTGYDLAVMPNGDLILGQEYSIARYTTGGTLVSSFGNLQDPQHLTASFNDSTDISLTNVRGIAYDASTDTTYVSMLGYSGGSRTQMSFKIMALDGFSDTLKGITTYTYAEDLYAPGNGQLMAGSWAMPPGVFDANLQASKPLGDHDILFVTAMPVPEASTLGMMLLGLGGVFALRASRRRG